MGVALNIYLRRPLQNSVTPKAGHYLEIYIIQAFPLLHTNIHLGIQPTDETSCVYQGQWKVSKKDWEK
jgi:hypothetical protein